MTTLDSYNLNDVTIYSLSPFTHIYHACKIHSVSKFKWFLFLKIYSKSETQNESLDVISFKKITCHQIWCGSGYTENGFHISSHLVGVFEKDKNLWLCWTKSVLGGWLKVSEDLLSEAI